MTYNEFSYLSSIDLTFSGVAQVPANDSIILSAPGAGYRHVLYSVHLSIGGSTNAVYGDCVITAGLLTNNIKLFHHRHQGGSTSVASQSWERGVALPANTALQLTLTESASNIFMGGTITYRIERV
jgi:hypothetical protein